MDIQYIKGDLMTAKEPYILHGCNSCGVMGSGVANLIRIHYPEAYLSYVKTFNKSGLALGKVFFVSTEGKTIINAITQENFGRDGAKYVCYDAIRNVMKDVNKHIPVWSKVAMPKIGAGLGGGDWKIISEIIEQESTQFFPVVYEI